MPTYDKAYFIAKFEAIPDSLWKTGSFLRTEETSPTCALGHCGVRHWDEVTTHPQAVALTALLRHHKPVWEGSDYWAVTHINDGTDESPYKQPTPKARILAALRDLP